jgi:hypothetical protein
MAGEYHPAQGSWTTTTLADASTSGAGLAMTSDGVALGALRSTSYDGELHYTMWSAGIWSPPAAVSPAPAPLVTTRERPAVAAGTGAFGIAFHGDNFKHYYGAYTASWQPAAEPIGGAALQSFGPAPASIAMLGADVVVAFAGSNGDLYDETRSNDIWQAASGHALGDVVGGAPAIAALTQGAELMIEYQRKSDSKLFWTTRSAGVWTVPLEIANAMSSDPPALAPLSDGGAVTAFRGLDGKIYAARYTPQNAIPWSAPVPISNPNFAIAASPALARGVGGYDAEIAFIDAATGSAYHARLLSNSWTAPNQVGGVGLTHIAITSAP